MQSDAIDAQSGIGGAWLMTTSRDVWWQDLNMGQNQLVLERAKQVITMVHGSCSTHKGVPSKEQQGLVGDC